MRGDHRLAKAASDASMGAVLRQLEYKCAWYGRGFVRVDRFYPSSKTCGRCGAVYDGLTLAMREWSCPECGCVHDRDLNAACNIAREGRRILEGTAGHAGTGAKAPTLVEQA
jgi:putative transposase